MGLFRPCPSLRLLTGRVGGMLRCCNPPNRYEWLDTRLEQKVIEATRNGTPGTRGIRSINAIILRFPQLRRGLEAIRTVFHQYDDDSNGAIDRDEFKNCLQELRFPCTEREINDLYELCDVGGRNGVRFREFIVLLCLGYLLAGSSSELREALTAGSTEVKATFDTIIEAFLFLDKNGDGQLNKKDLVMAMNEDFPLEKPPTHITLTRFKEMDWDRDGKVGFREFVFSLINWVGIEP